MSGGVVAGWIPDVAGVNPAARDRAYAAPLLLGAMVAALISGRLETALIAFVLAWAGAARSGAGVPARAWFGVVLGGAAISLALNLYLVRGPSLPGPVLFGLAPSAAGLRAGTLLALRLAGASLAVHGLRAAWPGERAADEAARALRALERLRVPVGEARTVLGLALRFAPLMASEARRIVRLQEARAGRTARGLGERLEQARAAAVPIVVSALERADRVSLALEARHYRGGHECAPFA
jgi:energy-coupling factor transporter transmembrane protein EcfT